MNNQDWRQDHMTLKAHWETVYRTKASDQVGWYQQDPSTSLRLLQACGLALNTCLIDVGGGYSRLVDNLIARGLRCLTVLPLQPVVLYLQFTSTAEADLCLPESQPARQLAHSDR
jgi:hypothetical protein